MATIGRPPTWDRASVRAALRAWTATHGRVPVQRDWTGSTPDRPSYSTVACLFDTWREALVDASACSASSSPSMTRAGSSCSSATQLYAGDRVAWTQAQPVPRQPRVENGSRGALVEVLGDQAQVLLDGTERIVTVGPEHQEGLRLAYAQHLYRQQGATVDRAVTLTGGWQTSREGAYVQASRAREGIDWHVAREQLGEEAPTCSASTSSPTACASLAPRCPPPSRAHRPRRPRRHGHRVGADAGLQGPRRSPRWA